MPNSIVGKLEDRKKSDNMERLGYLERFISGFTVLKLLSKFFLSVY